MNEISFLLQNYISMLGVLNILVVTKKSILALKNVNRPLLF